MLRNTYTTDDFTRRLHLLRQYYTNHLYSERSASLSDVLAGTCTPETMARLEEWQVAFGEANISEQTIHDCLGAIEEELKMLPVVTLYIPVRFSADYVTQFGEWFRSNVAPQILIALHTDPRVGGGCGIVWKDIYHDFSFRHYARNERGAILDMINSYTHE